MQADFYQTAAPGAMEKISRAEAKAQGLKRFFTGEPCMHGHVAPRYVSNKRCVVCNQKPYDEKRRNYGAAWRKANKQRCAQYSTAYRERNPSVSAEYMRRIRAKKRPEMRAKERQKYASNPTKYLAKNKAYREKNPEYYALAARNRRALKKGSVGHYSKEDLNRIRLHQKGRCAYFFECRSRLARSGEHVDHIISLSKGGSNWPSNIQLLCPTCNLRKRDRDPIEFAQRLGRLL